MANKSGNSLFSLFFLLFFTLLLSLSSLPRSLAFRGDITAYGDGWQGGACLYQDLPEPAKKSFVAINQVLWDSMGMQQVCGRCVKISYGGKTVMGMVTNRCPECKRDDLDLSDSLFKEATGSHPSRLTASWELVDCGPEMGVTGNVGFFTKDGSNGNWLAIHPTNFRSPITKLSVEYPAGRVTEMRFGVYGLNYYLAAGLDIRGRFTLHATDAAGRTISASAEYVSASSYLGGAWGGPGPSPSPSYPPPSPAPAPSPPSPAPSPSAPRPSPSSPSPPPPSPPSPPSSPPSPATPAPTTPSPPQPAPTPEMTPAPAPTTSTPSTLPPSSAIVPTTAAATTAASSSTSLGSKAEESLQEETIKKAETVEEEPSPTPLGSEERAPTPSSPSKEDDAAVSSSSDAEAGQKSSSSAAVEDAGGVRESTAQETAPFAPEKPSFSSSSSPSIYSASFFSLMSSSLLSLSISMIIRALL